MLMLIPFATFLLLGAIYSLLDETLNIEWLTSIWIIFWMLLILPPLCLIELPKIKIFMISDKKLEIKNPFTGNIDAYLFDELDGFKTQIQVSNSGSYEVIYIIKDAVKIQEISSFHVKNYNEVKKGIREKLSYLGTESFKFFRYLMEGLKRKKAHNATQPPTK